MRDFKGPLAVGLTGFLATLAASWAVWPRLPPRVPVHWNIHGQADGYGSRAFLVSFGPALLLGIWGLVTILKFVDPKVKAREKALLDGPDRAEALAELEKSRRAGDTFVCVLLAFFALLHGLLLALSAGLLREPGRPLGLLFAAFLLAAGNSMTRVRPNWFLGIRTPWTLSDDQIWRRTHRLGGRLMVLAGAALLPLSLALPPPSILVALLFLVLGALLPPAAWSYVLWRRRVQA